MLYTVVTINEEDTSPLFLISLKILVPGVGGLCHFFSSTTKLPVSWWRNYPTQDFKRSYIDEKAVCRLYREPPEKRTVLTHVGRQGSQVFVSCHWADFHNVHF